MEPILGSFFDRCSIYERSFVTEQGRQKEKLTMVAENLPCALSYLQRQEAKEGERAYVSFLCSLFLPADAAIPSGGAVLVHHLGEELWFEAAGEEKRYSSHREVTVRRRREL